MHSKANAHTRAVSSVCWYRVDTGMFLTGGFDGDVCVWDTNRFRKVFTFNKDSQVGVVAMSPCARSHSIAMGTRCGATALLECVLLV